MAHLDNGQWKKRQKVEIYDLSQDQWISGKIIDILENDGQKIYCVAYNEYYKEICDGDADSLIRNPNTNQQSGDVNVKGAFLNYSKEIASELPILRQIRVLTQDAERLKAQRMIYLLVKCVLSLTSF